MNILSNDVEIKGTITFAHQLTIEGRVEGDVITQGDLTIGESATIKGRVNASNVLICGKVEGNVTATQRCQARATAIIFGDVTAGAFSAEEGATFQGRSRVGKAAVAAAAAASASAGGNNNAGGQNAAAAKPAAAPASGGGSAAPAPQQAGQSGAKPAPAKV
jgi:cytoskeletal protein CcmA (bactofilin family)